MRELPHAGGEEEMGAGEGKTDVYHGITLAELRTKWQETVRDLERRGIRVTNAENALEGALSIRYTKLCMLISLHWLEDIASHLHEHDAHISYSPRIRLKGSTAIIVRLGRCNTGIAFLTSNVSRI